MGGPEIDVISVHQSAFARCCEAVATVRARPHSASVLVYGESGSGKTHLLARLRARVAGEETAREFSEAIFVSAPLRASARMIWPICATAWSRISCAGQAMAARNSNGCCWAF